MNCDCGNKFERINFTGCHDPLRDWYQCFNCGKRLSLIEYKKKAGLRKEREKNICPCGRANECIAHKIDKRKYVGIPLI